MRKARTLALLAALIASGPLTAGVPPVPVPAENPITEPKRVLGKILFWDEQLSSDDSVACGTCHRPGAGGADPRAARHPGTDKGTIDDVMGSPGIVSLDRDGKPYTIEATGLLARAIQHEIDHLDGILFLDHLGAMKRQWALRKYKREHPEGRQVQERPTEPAPAGE